MTLKSIIAEMTLSSSLDGALIAKDFEGTNIDLPIQISDEIKKQDRKQNRKKTIKHYLSFKARQEKI